MRRAGCGVAGESSRGFGTCGAKRHAARTRQARHGAISEESSAVLAFGAVVGFIAGVADALNFRAADGAWLAIASMDGHFGAKGSDLFRKAGTGLAAEPFDPVAQGGLRRCKQHVDLLVGVVPIVNLEWIQKIYRDTSARGYSAEAVTQTILRRMHDYVHFITPQFSRTHVNFQRVPTVDTSNPFIARAIPTLDESMVVIRFRNPKDADFPFLLNMIHDSFMSRPNTIVVPGGKMGMAIELILTPMILDIVAKSRA